MKTSVFSYPQIIDTSRGNSKFSLPRSLFCLSRNASSQGALRDKRKMAAEKIILELALLFKLFLYQSLDWARGIMSLWIITQGKYINCFRAEETFLAPYNALLMRSLVSVFEGQ